MILDGSALLLGAMYVADAVDSIGVAVFGIPGGNTAYIAEMDADFKIVEFLDFHNYEGFLIDYNLPEVFKLRPYVVGGPAPMPFWLDGVCHIIEGEAEADDVFRLFGDRASINPVLLDMRRYLADARSGFFQDQIDRWTVDDIAKGFSDIFHEPPVHSRYWITRLGDAVRYSRSLTQPPHPIDDELRRAALEWIERFATKTDFDRLMAVIENLLAGAITSERAQAMVFAFLINKIQNRRFPEIEKRLISNKSFGRLFPQGIFFYWWRYNWPKLTFKYDRPIDILDPLIIEIGRGAARKNFIRAERMAFLFFGREDAPQRILNETYYLKEEYLKKLDRSKSKADIVLYDRRRVSEWEMRARQVLYNYHILMALDGITAGEMRLSRETVDRRFGLDSFYVKQLEEIVGLA